ncbi:MAG: flavin reductase family protein [Pirellulales bacterium]
MNDTTIDPIVGRIPSGIFILTIGTGARATGMLVSWVMQAGFAPPTITVAVKQGRHVADWIGEGQPFVVNVVGESQKSWIQHFAKGFEVEDPTVFEGIETTHCARGIPILKAGVGHLECQAIGQMASEDHIVFLAKVVRGQMAFDEQPLVHIRKSGSHY